MAWKFPVAVWAMSIWYLWGEGEGKVPIMPPAMKNNPAKQRSVSCARQFLHVRMLTDIWNNPVKVMLRSPAIEQEPEGQEHRRRDH